MKKKIALLLAVVVCLSGCNSENESLPSATPNDSSSTEISQSETSEMFSDLKSEFSEPISSSETASDTESNPAQTVSNSNTESKIPESLNITLNTGKILDIIVTDDNVLVIKAKIKSLLSNKQTINQNYHNVEDIIRNQGGDKYREIQYWAVADMMDGSESKVISFTVPEDVIKSTANGYTVAIQYPDLVTDLWILPSLRE